MIWSCNLRRFHAHSNKDKLFIEANKLTNKERDEQAIFQSGEQIYRQKERKSSIKNLLFNFRRRHKTLIIKLVESPKYKQGYACD